MFVSVLSSEEPCPSVAIFALHGEWEERTEGGHRTRGDRAKGRGGDQTGAGGAMSDEGGGGGEVVTRLRRPRGGTSSKATL